MLSKIDSLILKESLSSLETIRGIEDAFEAVDRSRCAIADLIEMRYRVQHWRTRTAQAYLALTGPKVAMPEKSFAALSELKLQLPRERVRELAARLHENPSREAIPFFVRQGCPIGDARDRLQAGPQKILEIPAVEGSDWSFGKWSEFREFSEYLFEGDGVRYRGQLLLPGDVFLVSTNSDGDGVFSSLLSPRRYMGHSSFFVILEKGGLRFPAVLEVHERGLRAVPLSLEFSAERAPYLEIYRLRDPAPGFFTRINRVASEMLNEPHPYDLHVSSDDPHALTCPRVGELLYLRAGERPSPARSRLRGLAGENAGRLGIRETSVLSPTDFLRDPKMGFVGVVDHGFSRDLVLRELVSETMGGDLRTLSLDPEAFGLSYFFTRKVIEHIQREGFASRSLQSRLGFSPAEFPKGPAAMLAFARPMREASEGAIQHPSLQGLDLGLDREGLFSYEEFSRSRLTADAIGSAMEKARRRLYVNSPRSGFSTEATELRTWTTWVQNS